MKTGRSWERPMPLTIFLTAAQTLGNNPTIDFDQSVLLDRDGRKTNYSLTDSAKMSNILYLAAPAAREREN